MERDEELLNYVVEEIQFLRSLHVSATSDQIRRASVQLRSLLIEGVLQRSWRQIFGKSRGKLKITTRRLVLPRGNARLDWAILGGATTASGSVVKVTTYDGALSGDALRRLTAPEPEEQPVDLDVENYLNGTVVIHQRQPVNRRQVLQYVAHKKGGAHFDSSRSPDDVAYRVLDSIPHKFGGNNREGQQEMLTVPQHQVLSYIQEVCDAEDVATLLSAI